MNLKTLLNYALLSAVIILVSCNKDDDSNNRGAFSKNSVEENKQALEDAGIALIRGVAEIETDPAIDAIEALFFFLQLSDPFESRSTVNMKAAKLRGSYAFIPNYSLANMDELGYEGVLKSLAVNPMTDEPETIQGAYELLKGTYSWNSMEQQWNYSPVGKSIKFEFPMAESKSVNNASYAIKYEAYDGIVNDLLRVNYPGDLPMQVKTTMKLKGEEIMNFNVNINYSDFGLPTGITSRIKLRESKFIFSADNIDNKEANLSFVFKNNDQLLLKFVLAGEGNWNKDNIDQNTHYYQYVVTNNLEFQEVEVSSNENWDSREVDVHKVIQGGNSLFQVLNIKVEGIIDTEAIGNEIVSNENLNILNDSLYWDAICQTMNENIDLSLRYVDTDEIIALVEAYPVSRSVSYYEYFYNGTWQDNPVLEEYSYYEISFRFRFADDSTIDLEVYFGEGFEDLVMELENLIIDLETEEEVD